MHYRATVLDQGISNGLRYRVCLNSGTDDSPKGDEIWGDCAHFSTIWTFWTVSDTNCDSKTLITVKGPKCKQYYLQ